MKKKISAILDGFFEKKYISTFVTIIIIYVGLQLAGRVSDNLQATAIKRIIYGIVIIVLLSWLRKGHMYANNFRKFSPKGIILTGLMLIIASIHLVIKLALAPVFDVKMLFLALTVGLAAGITEEFMTRGFPLGNILPKVKSKKEIICIAVFSSVVFGFMHIGHVFLDGEPLFETVLQCVNATCVGMYLAAVYLRTGSLVPGIIAHAYWDSAVTYTPVNLQDYAGNIDNSSAASGVSVVVLGGILLASSVFMLRKSKWDEIEKNFGINIQE